MNNAIFKYITYLLWGGTIYPTVGSSGIDLEAVGSPRGFK